GAVGLQQHRVADALEDAAQPPEMLRARGFRPPESRPLRPAAHRRRPRERIVLRAPLRLLRCRRTALPALRRRRLFDGVVVRGELTAPKRTPPAHRDALAPRAEATGRFVQECETG